MTKIDRPQPGDLLSLAFETFNVRGGEYNTASLEDHFREAAAVATIILGKSIEARDVALILTSVKLARLKASPGKIDSYVDGMNYLAFAACFQGLVPLPVPKPPELTKTKLQETVEFVEQHAAKK